MDDSRVARLLRIDSVAAALASALAAFFTGSIDAARRRLPLVALTASVVGTATALLVMATRPAGTALPGSHALFVLWVALLTVTELTPVRMPRGGFMTVSSAFD